jgi:hypothetical protein
VSNQQLALAKTRKEDMTMDFATILSKISAGAQIAQEAAPEIEQYGDNHVAATQEILQVAGAGVAAESTDKNVQAEALASAQVASKIVPLVFKLLSSFKHPKPAAPKIAVTP